MKVLAKRGPGISAKITKIPVPKELHFAPEKHIYTVNGEQLPSVSQIIRLDDRSESYDGIPEHVLQKAADRGNKVHAAIEQWIMDGCAGDPWHDDPETHDYLMAFNDFVRLGFMQPFQSELLLYHPELRYAGTIDILALVGGKPALIDVKTTSKYLERKCQLQLAGYGDLIGFWGPKVDRIFSDRKCDRFILHLDRRKGPKLHRMRDTESHDRDFRALVAQWHTEHGATTKNP